MREIGREEEEGEKEGEKIAGRRGIGSERKISKREDFDKKKRGLSCFYGWD